MSSVRQLLDQPNTISVLQNADANDHHIANLVQEVKRIDSKISTVSQFLLLFLLMSTSFQIEGLLNVGLGIEKDNRQGQLYIALKTLSDKLKSLRKQTRADASHQAKRSFVSYRFVSVLLGANCLCKIHSLGLNQKPMLLQHFLDSNSNSDLSDLDFNGIKVVRRKRTNTSPIKPRSVLADTVCYPGDAVVNAETGFYTVAPDESVIFVSSNAEG